MNQKTFALFTFILFAQVSTWAIPFGIGPVTEFQVPALTAPVMDLANVIPARQEEMLNQLLRDFNSRGKAQLTILTLDSLNGQSIEDASIKITDQWKLGTEKKDNGILFLIVPQERKVRIEVGQGLEGVIPDVVAKRILADVARPYFKKGLYAEGIYSATTQVLKIVDHEYMGTNGQANVELELPQDRQFWIFLILFFIVFPFLSFISRKQGFRRGGWGGPGHWGGGSWGGGGGSGGWSGGGGGFSGGGASDSW